MQSVMVAPWLRPHGSCRGWVAAEPLPLGQEVTRGLSTDLQSPGELIPNHHPWQEATL